MTDLLGRCLPRPDITVDQSGRGKQRPYDDTDTTGEHKIRPNGWMVE